MKSSKEKELSKSNVSRSRGCFLEAKSGIQDLIREILREERDVQHLSRRSDIHARIYEHIRRLIK